MRNARRVKSAQRIQKTSFFRVKGMVISGVYDADSRCLHGLCELLRSTVRANLTSMIGQSTLAIDKDQIGPVEGWGQPFQRIVQQFFVGRIVLGIFLAGWIFGRKGVYLPRKRVA